MNEELGFLEGLLTHPGFLMFREYARQQWGGDGYGRRVKVAIATAKERHEDIAAAVAAVDAAQTEINALVSWPMERAKQLRMMVEAEHAVSGSSRRGPNL